MKKIAFILVILFLTGSMAMAQTPRANMTPQERATHMTEKMAKDYSLTDEQKQRIHDLNHETFQKWGDKYSLPDEDYRANKANLTEEQLKNHREEMLRERNNYNERVKGIMNDDQYRNYLEKQQAKEQEMKNKTHQKRRELHLD